MAIVPAFPTGRFGRRLNNAGGGLPTIDSGNPLSNKLAFFWVPIGGGYQYDIVNRRLGTYSGSSLRGGQWGVQTTLNGTSGPVFAEGRAAITSSIPSTGLGDLTLAVIANPAANAVSLSRGLSQSNNNVLFNSPEVNILFNSDYLGNPTSGMLVFQAYDGVSTPEGVQIAAAVDGNFHLFAGIRSNAAAIDYSLNVDGVPVAGTASGPTTADIRNNYIGVGTYGEGTSGSSNATFVGAAAWNRALSSGELAELYRDFFQLLIWPSDIILAKALTGLVSALPPGSPNVWLYPVA